MELDVNRVRPIAAGDLDALLDLARGAGTGFTSLPPVREVLERKIARSLASFGEDVKRPGPERYMFVLEDMTSRTMLGCCAIEAACGLEEPFYSYHVGLTVQASPALDVYKRLPTLYLSNDLTGASMLCSLYLNRDARQGGNGAMLSKSRFLFMAAFPQRFADKVIAEMRGVSDENGRSPFWEGLGRHFFDIEYGAAEHVVGQGNKAVIAELMPKHPIYTVLLPAEAQAVLGQVHPETAPALRFLEQERFRYQGYIDIFDGGPSVEAPLRAIRSVRRSLLLPAIIEDGRLSDTRPLLIANEQLADYRCTMAEARSGRDGVQVSPAVAAALQISDGETVRVCPL
ncbi:arginine N-succinyltransferase [Solimonas terrae]|uniref:Arginine N-succinyltransferase n=1 Tax=Solimonas terrae TaxID=1396819 RepID=A0A6M2BT12_9GAMM|nr:arginine N-succinyltransferase [Solimonas terrae]NGY05480.1 arginine N-succinyltransferase [Solimonas terrae]